MRSRIIHAQVMHARLEPIPHEFVYPTIYYLFDLDELEELDRELPLFSYNKTNLTALFDIDYLRDWKSAEASAAFPNRGSVRSVRDKLEQCLQEFGCTTPVGRVELITAVRYFRYVFNPVSFYYCYSRDGAPLYHVAEINNTYGERHLYVLGGSNLPDRNRGTVGETQQGAWYRAAKSFFVSPFNRVEGDYEFRFGHTTDGIDVRITILQGETAVFRSRVWGRALPLTTANQIRTYLRYPVTAALTIPRIYWQAQKLRFMKKLPMLDKPNPSSPATIKINPPSFLERWSMRAIRPFLQSVRRGYLTLVYPDGSREAFGDPNGDLRATMRLHNYKVFWRVVRDGGIGLGEAYQACDWDTDDLPTVIKFFLENVDQHSERKLNVLWPVRLLHTLRHRRRHNSEQNSRHNIQEHYDLGNDFFKLFLDASMTYSSGIYRSSNDSLEDAQRNKLQAIIDKALIGPDDHVLEIGSGWGSFAIMAAQQTGCRVTTITISEEQYAAVRERVKAERLEGRVDVKLIDYRNLNGQYDRIVSIEMMEALGHEYLPVFFKKCEELLKPGGLMVVQVITMLDQWYDEYRKRADWIQKYIFPGSHLPSLGALNQSVTSTSQLLIENVENIAPHYAKTLAEWRRRFRSVRGKLERMGYDEHFQRTFDFYFASCEAEFGARVLNLLQIVLTRPNNQTLIEHDRVLLGAGVPRMAVVG